MYSYPACMNWDSEFLAHVAETQGSEASIYMKRRKFGKFIGLRGCETPVEELQQLDKWLKKKEEMAMKMDDAAFWGKRGWGRW